MQSINKRCLLMLDFDGTLVTFARAPNEVVVPPSTIELLEQLKAKHQVFIISGRSRESITKLLPSISIIGMHGLDWPNENLPLPHPMLTRTLQTLKRLKVKHPDIYIENKVLGLAVHVRRLPKQAQAIAISETETIFQAAVHKSQSSHLDPLDILHGHCVIEIRPKAASKRLAVERLMKQFSSLFPVFIGDDQTDEEAFCALNERGLSIRVAESTVPTQAQMRLKNVDTVLDWLKALC